MSERTTRRLRGGRDADVMAARAADGDPAAWTSFSRHIRALVMRSIRSRTFPVRIRRTSEAGALADEVIERVKARDFRRLRMFLEIKDSYPQLRLASWLRILAKGTALERTERDEE